MPAGPPFRMEGSDKLYAVFRELPKATKRNVLLRTLKQVIEPLAHAVANKAPYLTGYLSGHMFTGVDRDLTRRQRRMEREEKGDFVVKVHFGTADPAGMMNEFGNAHQAAQPFFRQEWEARKHGMVDEIGAILGPEIESAGVRLAKKNGVR